jgi:hypothetical protein
MFNKILILLTAILLIQSINSLNSADLCKSSVCNEEYSYKCTKNLCSFNKQMCIDYYKTKMKIDYTSRSYHNSPSFHSCESNKLTENDYCIRRTNCYKKVFLDIGYITINKKRKIKKDCKCDSKHSFKCGEYCTINNKYCDVLNLRIKYQKKMNKSDVKICPSY